MRWERNKLSIKEKLEICIEKNRFNVFQIALSIELWKFLRPLYVLFTRCNSLRYNTPFPHFWDDFPLFIMCTIFNLKINWWRYYTRGKMFCFENFEAQSFEFVIRSEVNSKTMWRNRSSFTWTELMCLVFWMTRGY